MFNRTIFFAGDALTRVNAVSGGIVKNHKDSYFLRFHLNSKRAKQLLSQRPHINQEEYPYNLNRYVEVLQMVICGDMEVIAEVIDLPKEKETLSSL